MKREANPELFTSRVVNKMWYVWYGSKAGFNTDVPLSNLIDLEVGVIKNRFLITICFLRSMAFLLSSLAVILA